MKKKILIVASNYYNNITDNLISNALSFLSSKQNIKVIRVNGTFEIPSVISKNLKKYYAFIALGCVIKGETPHFDFICSSTFYGLMKISIESRKPIGNGIITCLNMRQAKKRSVIKGKEASKAVLQVLNNGK